VIVESNKGKISDCIYVIMVVTYRVGGNITSI